MSVNNEDDEMNTFSTRIRRVVRRRDPRRLSGMTLVEIMIVVIIMALIATAVGVAVLPRLKEARIQSTRTDAQTVRSAVEMYVSEHPGGDCPDMEVLTAGGYLNASLRTTDAWDNDFVMECDGDAVYVMSAGPDGQMSTEDDVE